MSQINLNSEAMQTRKQVLRQQMRAVRAALSPIQCADASALIGARLEQLIDALKLARNDAVAVFLTKGEEVCLDATIASLLERGQCVVAPINATLNEAPFYTLSSVIKGIRIGAWGVREPVQSNGGKAYWPQDIKVVLVPGLAFDYQGGRLGYGGGWYDRVLGQVPLSIGVCYDCQLVAQVPCAAHDQRVAVVLTESQTIEMTCQRLKSRQEG